VDSFKAYCAQAGIPLERVFADEGKSGKSLAHRDAAEALIEYVSGNPTATILLLWDASRLGRNVDETQYLRAIIRKAGLTIIYTGDETLNITGKEQRLVEAVADYRADAFRDDLRKTVKRGMAAAARKGHYVSGRPPRCYKLKEDGDLTRLVPDPKLWERGKRAWELRAAGADFRTVHTETHLFARMTSYWHFFKNEIYTGAYTFLGERIESFCPPLCTPEQWRAVQTLRRDPYRPRASRAAQIETFMFSGLVFCPVCGRRRRGHDNNYRGAGGTQYYYRCIVPSVDRRQHCKAGHVRAAVLHAAVFAQLNAQFTVEQIAPQYRKWLAGQKKTGMARKRHIATVKADIKETERAVKNLTAALEAGGKNITALVARLAEKEARVTELRAKHAALQAAPEPEPIDIAARIESIRAQIFTATPNITLLRSIIARIDATPQEITVTLKNFWE
jgi:DNA invertase Pin-like site-specific DNA recombinase